MKKSSNEEILSGGRHAGAHRCLLQKGWTIKMETIYLAGGCLWGVQEFLKTLDGVVSTEAGRANGSSDTLEGAYDGYAECVKTVFDPSVISVSQLMDFLFEIIDPYSLNQQGRDRGEKYRTGVYSKNERHLEEARAWIRNRPDCSRIMVEVLPLANYVRSAEEHQDRLTRCPEDYSYCHIPRAVMYRHQKKSADGEPG